ncbi:MAG: UDP-N-acetylmuramoyl-L-alanyl-D-glutamate--2,6-diaminopimelate ligase [Acholeplasmatales bacterium]|nr:UDP-N-acetylmuramoyl-L-alanyl-D-glutamate--2,6-diaminopimelate ligase [Acholeplasmatales bacterium]
MHISKLYPKVKKDIIIRGITDNSKLVRKNFIFVAIKGHKKNGLDYIDEAIANGAILIIANKKIRKKVLSIKIKDPKLEYSRLLKKFYTYSALYTVGVTGTDGKTTTTKLLNSIFNCYSSSASIGTNGIEYLNKNIKTINTTPSPDILFPAFHTFCKHEIQNTVMEVSSEGILDKRVDNVDFNGAIFTNLSHEHLNTHKNMNSYFLCKAKLFEKINHNGLIVANSDDKESYRIPFYTDAKIVYYGFKYGDYVIKNYDIHENGSTFNILYKGYTLGEFKTSLFGKYNIYNCLAAIAYAYELGIPLKYIKKGINKVNNISGRFIKYTKNAITGIIDFAHTPNAIKNLLESIKLFAKGRIILVMGAQGEKDKSKRSKMGVNGVTLSDITIFTSEDPKNESLFGILNDLTKKLKNKEYYITLSRAEAIKLAARIARPNDIIVITGKGNENEEIILNYHFKHNDLDILKKALDS